MIADAPDIVGAPDSGSGYGPSPIVGNLVGMAYIVRRPRGRFEIRESVATPKGPRARSLANFAVLTSDALTRAAARAVRPFDAETVVVSGRRAGAPVEGRLDQPDLAGSEAARSFVAASRRFASSIGDEEARARPQVDPGRALQELIEFAEEVARHLPDRGHKALEFPVLAHLAARRAP